MPKCIYCLKEKDEKEFNREHVVSRMMGTYQDGFVLNHQQVCEKCNTYFSTELEVKIGLDSLESFLRMQHGNKMSDGRSMRSGRVRFSGAEGIFKGLRFTPIVDNTNPERIRFDIFPCIGILDNEELDEYRYYAVEELPEATAKVLARIGAGKRGIITVGIEQSVAEEVLRQKGYLVEKYKYQDTSVTDIYKENFFETKINYSIDSIVRRVCAKTVFNYLCYSNGKDFVLSPEFDNIRNYIRYGTWSDDLWFRYSKGPVSIAEMPNETSHVVGFMLYPDNDVMQLCGCVTWFGEITYIFKLCNLKMLGRIVCTNPNTKLAYFDNEERKIIEDDSATFVFQKKPQPSC